MFLSKKIFDKDLAFMKYSVEENKNKPRFAVTFISLFLVRIYFFLNESLGKDQKLKTNYGQENLTKPRFLKRLKDC